MKAKGKARLLEITRSCYEYMYIQKRKRNYNDFVGKIKLYFVHLRKGLKISMKIYLIKLSTKKNS